MQNQNEKQTVKKPSPEQSQQDMQKSGKQQQDKKMAGQKQPNMPNKSQQEEKNREDMGSGKRQDDN